MPSLASGQARRQRSSASAAPARSILDHARPTALGPPSQFRSARRSDGVAMDRFSATPRSDRALVIGCGALARELLAVAERVPGLDVACLAPDLHNRPDGIPAAVRRRIRRARADGYECVFVAYADCGTGGLLEPVLAEEGVERLPGAHCYEVFAGSEAFSAMADAEPGTFWLTDFLARNFERLVIRGLGIDRHPELESIYFAHYSRVVYLSQTDDPELLAMARGAAERLGLAFEHPPNGITGLAAPVVAWAAASRRGHARAGDRAPRRAGDHALSLGAPPDTAAP